MNTNSNTYTVIYSIILVVVVAAVLAFVSVSLSDRQNANVATETRQSILSSVNLAQDADQAKDKNSYIIDITKDVTNAGKLFAFPDLQWVNRPVANRLIVDTVCPLQEGVKLLVVHSQTDRTKSGFGMPGIEKHNTVRIEWAIQRLPQAVMATREADPRVGYGTFAYADYSEDPLQVKNKSIIRRWRLEVKPEDRAKYENGELVEPAEPIRVYLNASVDGGYREAAVKAVGEWNEAFAAAGFKNVLQLQEGEAPAQWGYHSIVVSFLECLPKLYTVSNPYTGEIIGKYERLPFFQTMFRLHRWLLGSRPADGGIYWGKLLVGISTLLFVFVLLSGVVIWWPRTKKGLRNSLKIVTRRGWPRFWYGLHVAGGMYALLLLLLMALTGLSWSFGWYREWVYGLLGADARPLVKALHIGTWGGMITRILYFLAALLGAILPITGYYLWIRRLRRK